MLVKQNDFGTLKVELKFIKCVLFYRIRKIVDFLLDARSNAKITAITTIDVS